MTSPSTSVSTHIDIRTAALARVFARWYSMTDAEFARHALVYFLETRPAPLPAGDGRKIDLEIAISELGATLFACVARHNRTDLSSLLANALGVFTAEIDRRRRAAGGRLPGLA